VSHKVSYAPRSQNCGISAFEMLGRFGLGGQVWPDMHNSNQKSSNCNKEVAPKTCHFKQTICRLQKNLIFTQFFPFSSLNLWFTHVLSRKCRKWHLRALVGSFSLKSRMVGRLDNSGAGPCTVVEDKISKKKASWPGFLASGKDSRTKVVMARKIGKQGLDSTPEFRMKTLKVR